MSASRWLSANPDKAFAEKLYLLFLPVFFAYNALIQQLGWLDAGTVWHVVQNFGMWFPYCVALPAWLRRGRAIAWHQSAWFKLNLYMAVWVFYATYFHTEYFFEVLGLRYRFPYVTWTFSTRSRSSQPIRLARRFAPAAPCGAPPARRGSRP
jgi:cycloeucalenol cycloisomerase